MGAFNPLVVDGRSGPICIVGAGYVGLVTAVCLADTGVQVRLVDVDSDRLEMIRSGRTPIHEPMLDELLTSVLARGTLTLSGDIASGISGAAIAMFAVGTPPLADGRADISQVRSALMTAVAHAGKGTVMVIKSTVPPGTTASLRHLCNRNGRSFPLCVCPEFLAEGSAVTDFRRPPQVVIGGDDRAGCERVAQLFASIDAPLLITNSTSAELIKYGTNAFLALKISFINEMAQLCELTGADVGSVADGVGADGRIGRAFLGAGLGFGGSCFPKDVRALDQAASYHGQTLWDVARCSRGERAATNPFRRQDSESLAWQPESQEDRRTRARVQAGYRRRASSAVDRCHSPSRGSRRNRRGNGSGGARHRIPPAPYHADRGRPVRVRCTARMPSPWLPSGLNSSISTGSALDNSSGTASLSTVATVSTPTP